PQHAAGDRGRPHEGGHVRRDAPSGQIVQPRAEGRPGDTPFPLAVEALPAPHLGPHLLVERAEGGALAEDLQRHPLPDVALRPPVDEEAALLPHHVDEAGGHGAAPALHLPPPPPRAAPAPLPAAGAAGAVRAPRGGHAAGVGRPAAAAVDRPPADPPVVAHRAPPRAAPGRGAPSRPGLSGQPARPGAAVPPDVARTWAPAP